METAVRHRCRGSLRKPPPPNGSSARKRAHTRASKSECRRRRQRAPWVAPAPETRRGRSWAWRPLREIGRADTGLLDGDQQALCASLDRIGQQPDDRRGGDGGDADGVRCVEVTPDLRDRHACDRCHRRVWGEAQSGQCGTHPDLTLQPGVDVGVAGAVGTTGRQRQTAGLACQRGHGGAAIAREHRTGPRRELVVVGGDHQGAFAGAADLVQHGGRTAEDLGDGGVGRQGQRGQQHRAVAALQQRKVT